MQYCNHNVTINVLGKTHILITTHAVTSFEWRTLWSSLNLTEIENNKIAANYNSVLTEQLGSTDVDERWLELKRLLFAFDLHIASKRSLSFWLTDLSSASGFHGTWGHFLLYLSIASTWATFPWNHFIFCRNRRTSRKRPKSEIARFKRRAIIIDLGSKTRQSCAVRTKWEKVTDLHVEVNVEVTV